MKMNRLLRFGVVAGATAFAAGAGLTPAAASGGGGPTAVAILGSGSDTTQQMMDGVDNLYRFSDGCAQIPTGGVNPAPTTVAWLDFSCQSPDPVTASKTGTTTSGSPNLSLTDTSGIDRGDQVSGPGVPAGTFVGSITPNSNIFLSSSTWQDAGVNAGAGAGTGTFSFSHTRTTENYTHDQPREAYFLGSSNGINQLCKKGQPGVAPIDFARSSRGPKTTDCAGLRFVAYAKDGISWEAWNQTGSGAFGMANTDPNCSPVGTYQFCLSQAQLKAIFVSCTITNWSQVGGANVAISIYTPQAGSGTRSTFDGFLGGSSDSCIPAAQKATHIVPENSNTAIINNGDQNSAIFPFSYGVWNNQVNGAGNTVLGAVDGVQPNQTTIGGGSFPYSRNLYNVYCSATCSGGASSPQAVNYVGEAGWQCNVGSAHSINPITGRNYHTDLYFIYTVNGFVPMPGGAIGGGASGADYCRLFTT